MNRTLLHLLFYITSFASVAILVMSMGWFLILFGIFILPLVIVHFVAGIRELRRPVIRQTLLVLSSFNLVLTCLLRPDGDDLNSYTGYSSLLYHMGVLDKPYMDTYDALFYLTILMFVFQLGVDLFMLIKRGPADPAGPESDFV